MKKYKKREMLSIVNTLVKANESIINYNNVIDQKQSISLLIKCENIAQELAVYMGFEGSTGNVLVSLLEEYCETVRQLRFGLEEGTVCRELTEKICHQLEQLAGGITCEIPEDKKEVLFLPYKAAMWDSFESVWKMSGEDKSCETYVMPIPYYDKNPDGTFGEMHDEGDEYPAYVPIISWKEYDIAKRRPDIIYIHNPYDNCNYVTSVHPMFYAKELKKHTNMLVYIPYFIAVDDKVEEGFCLLPGTLYSHRVIVQSEAIRQVYMRELLKFEAENHCRGALGNIEEKILALGSPKYDKLLDTRKDELEIPLHWKKIIQKQDGTWKKVIFYNISVAPFLANSEEMLNKISDTLQVFKKSQSDIALLWRPHPLLPATIKSMRPFLWNKYRGIVEQYRQEGWGIYDDTSDVDRAIVLSDAYYGDGGSVFELYKRTGKLIMVQNVHVLGHS